MQRTIDEVRVSAQATIKIMNEVCKNLKLNLSVEEHGYETVREALDARGINPFDLKIRFTTLRINGEDCLKITFPRSYPGATHYGLTFDSIVTNILFKFNGKNFVDGFIIPSQYGCTIKNQIYSFLVANNALDLLP